MVSVCGIACIYNPSKEIYLNTLTAMVTSLHHRGPDAKGIHIEQKGNLGLGNTRLSLVDVNERSNMPMLKHDILLTFNGEIYNFRQIRQELQQDGFTFDTDSDTEVIIASYRKWGIDCLLHFNGCFAFILLDKKQNKLFIARDQFGEKPLVYTRASNGDWLFASEIKALLCHPFVKRELNLDHVISELLFGLYGDRTMTFFKNILFLPAGHFIVFDLTDPGQDLRPRKYSPFDEIKLKQYSEKDIPDLIQQYRTLFVRSLKSKLGADVPLGVILSGGLDSSLITALADPLQYPLTKKQLDCFSIRYLKNRNIDLSYAALLCQSLEHVRLHEVLVNPRPALEDFERITAILEAPVSDMVQKSIFENYHTVNQYSLKGVLNGQGNDELWLGYYRTDDIFQYPNAEYTAENVAAYWYNGCSFSKYFTKAIQERAKGVIQDNIDKNFLPFDSDDKLDTLTRFSIRTHLQAILIEEDRLSMASGVEVRLPYLDVDLFTFALSVPAKYKIWDDREKYLVRMAAGNDLPERIINRKKKGFPRPSKGYFEHVLQATDMKKLKQSQAISQLFPMDSLPEIWEKLTYYEKYLLTSITLFERVYFQ